MKLGKLEENLKVLKKRLIYIRKKIKWFLQKNIRNFLFILMNFMFVAILIISILFSIEDQKQGYINWDSNAIGVLCQIITAIVSFIASTIGIAITLQKEDCLGISVKDFNNLRMGLRYSISGFITLTIILLSLNAGLYVTNLIIGSIGVAFVALLLCIYVIWCEVPLMVKSEKRLLKTIKHCLWQRWKSRKDLPKELKEVLKYLIIDNKTLKDTFNALRLKNNEYNKFLVMKLIELQCDAAFGLKQIESKQQQLRYADSILKNISDLITFDFDMTDFFDDLFLSYGYYITRALFQLDDFPDYNHKTALLIADSLASLEYYIFSEKQVKFIMSLVLSMVTTSVKDMDFSYVKALQMSFSMNYFNLGQDNHKSIVFALICLQFYFLCNDSENASEELKTKIKHHLKYSDIVNQTKVYSWKRLYYIFLQNFRIDFIKFKDYFSLIEQNLDIIIFCECHWVKLDREYALHWLLAQLLNSDQVYNLDFSMFNFDDESKSYLKSFGEKHFDEDKKFLVSDEITSILDFFDVEKESLQYFLDVEASNHHLFDFINALRKKDLMNQITHAESKKNEEISAMYKNGILQVMQREWGYDSSIRITSGKRTLDVLIDKITPATNYNEAMIEFLTKYIFKQLRLNIKTVKKIKKDDYFEENLKPILSGKYPFASDSLRYLGYYIHTDSIKKSFHSLCDKASSFKSHIFSGPTLVKKTGFAFNIEVSDCFLRDLTIKEISEEVEKYKRADGQYVYNGTFLSREEIEQIISKKYAILRISLRYQIKSSKDSIVEIER